MRLSTEQIALVIQVVSDVLGGGARVSLFGSRLDDSRSGGDVDLLVQAEPVPGLLQRAAIKNKIEASLGLPVDVVAAPLDVADAAQKPFVRLAMADSKLLGKT